MKVTKSLKGLSSRNFTAATTEEFLGGRQLAGIVQPAVIADSPAITAETLVAEEVSDWLSCRFDDKFWVSSVVAANAGSPNDVGDSFAVPSEILDEGPLAVVVGSSVSGAIDPDGDTDDITVFLVAGQTYLVSMRGAGADPLSDPLLQVFNPAGAGGTLAATDDDGGNDRNSLLTFTAATTGQYTIRAASFDNGSSDVGSYTVDVRVQGADAVGNTNGTSVPLALGTTTFGFRENGTDPGPAGFLLGDLDRYSVTLEAGHFYTFKLAGGWESVALDGQGGPNAMNTFLILRNATGGIVAQNDNVAGNDASSAIGFFAQTSGTYYLDVTAYSGNTGGYAVEFLDVDYSQLDPLDAFNWFSADNVDFVDVNGVPTAYVYFAAAGENFGETQGSGPPGSPLVSLGWNAREMQQLMLALEEFEHILGVNYEITTDVNQATFRLITTEDEPYGAYFYPQDPVYGTQQGIGAFNVDSGGWDKPVFSNQDIPGDQVSLDRGGFSFAVILHEFGHAHGLAHPHDSGGGSEILLGVTGATGSYGIFNLNQGVYSVMSYNDAWHFHPDGPSPFTISGVDNGWSATLSAFDIAVLQDRYGVHAYNEGDNVYTLTDIVDDAFYECIWDSGGTDAIAYGGALNATIDLLAATLDYSPTGGGVVSFVIDPAPGTSPLRGGYTIANGVVIENATGGSGNDTLIGNAAANVLTGNDGNDTMLGRAGDDTLAGGVGTDTARYLGNRADYTIEANLLNGGITSFTITDNNAADGDDGTDTLTGMEAAQFNDTTFNLAGAVAVFDGNGDLVSVHTTIQAAIDASQDGYRIIASAGTYAENLNVDVAVTIEGANAGVAGTGTRGAETILVGRHDITATGPVTIDGLRFVNDATTTGGGPSDPTLQILTGGGHVVTNSIFYSEVAGGARPSPDDRAISMPPILDGEITISNNYFTGAFTGAFSTASWGRAVWFDGGGVILNVTDNTFEYSRTGLNFDMSGDSEANVSGNTFRGTGTGIAIGIDMDGLTIIDNNFDNGGEEFNFRNLTQDITFDAEPAVATQVGPFIDVLGGSGNDTLLGTSFADLLDGNQLNPANADNDTLNGRAGSDVLLGRAGNDTLIGGADNDLLDGGAGLDTAEFAGTVAFSDTVIGWVVTSAEGNDFLQNVEIAVEGSGQRNLLVGSTGFAGIQAAFDSAEIGDIVRLASGTYTGSWTYDDAGLVVIAQPNARINGTFTTAGSDGITIFGANLADTITTGAGNDRLHGGAGNDTMAGGAGDDWYFVDGGDTVVEGALEGTGDRAFAGTSYTLSAGAHVEILSTTSHAGTAAIDLGGNELNNLIYGNAGDNRIDGHGGADVMVGFGGNDWYYVDHAGDRVVEGASEGTGDRVFASASYTLSAGAHIEIMSTSFHAGTAAIDLGGNELNNLIYGNAGSNVLDGKGGSDTLIGNGGADTFAFTTALGGGNVDILAGFGADDTIALDDAVFTGLGLGALDPNAFVTGTAAQDADDRIVYDQATGRLYYDADGNGAGAAVQFATLSGAPIISASDFQVI